MLQFHVTGCGKSSLNGITFVTSADTGKCLDYRVMLKDCDVCYFWEDRKKQSQTNFKILWLHMNVI